MAEQYAEENGGIFNASAHPGWADTPSVRSALPDFHRRMEGRLRTPEEGADTITWLAVSPAALAHANGIFFQGTVHVVNKSPIKLKQIFLNNRLLQIEHQFQLTCP